MSHGSNTSPISAAFTSWTGSWLLRTAGMLGSGSGTRCSSKPKLKHKINQSRQRRHNQSINQGNEETINQSIKARKTQSINQSIKATKRQSINQNWSISQSIELINGPTQNTNKPSSVYSIVKELWSTLNSQLFWWKNHNLKREYKIRFRNGFRVFVWVKTAWWSGECVTEFYRVCSIHFLVKVTAVQRIVGREGLQGR